MKNRKQKHAKKASTRGRRISVISIAVIATILVGAAIAIASKHLTRDEPVAVTAKAVANDSGRKYVTMKVAGRNVQVDPQTGQIQPLTPQEAQALANDLKSKLSKSTEGLQPVQHADGSVSMRLQDRFQNVVLARVTSEGTVEESCVDQPEQATQFFGKDPALVGTETTKTPPQPARLVPAKKVSQ